MSSFRRHRAIAIRSEVGEFSRHPVPASLQRLVEIAPSFAAHSVERSVAVTAALVVAVDQDAGVEVSASAVCLIFCLATKVSWLLTDFQKRPMRQNPPKCSHFHIIALFSRKYKMRDARDSNFTTNSSVDKPVSSSLTS